MDSTISEWITPATRPELIENLVSGVGKATFSLCYLRTGPSCQPADRYNPSNVGILEDYLYHQIRSQEYDCLANLAILKLYVLIYSFSCCQRLGLILCVAPVSYQFNPDLYNADVVINILIKAMTSAHFPDFNLCLSLLDERPLHLSLDRDEPDPLPTILPTLTAMSSLLHRCRFTSFWELYRSEELEDLRDNYTIECVGFEDSVRHLVVRSVRPTFTKISAERLGAYLDLSGECHVQDRAPLH